MLPKGLVKFFRGQKCRLKLIECIISRLDIDQIISQLNNSASPSYSAPASSPPSSVHSCPGAAFRWALGSPYLSYPFPIHDATSRFKPRYDLVSVDPHDTVIRVRSQDCLETSLSTSTPCFACQAVGPFVDAVKDRAEKSPVRLDCSVLSHAQAVQKIENIGKSLKKEKLARLDAIKVISRLRVHQETCRALFDLVGTQDVPGLYRIFKNSKANSWSMEKLFKMIRQAFEGTYHAKNFSELELDLAAVIYELGGGAALYALQKSPFAFPSRTTILKRRQNFKLCITVGQINMSDILANIETMFKDVLPGHRKAGMTLSMDEVASDGRLCYLPGTDDIAGLCEHAATGVASVKMGEDLNVIRAVTKAVRDGKVHIGQEVFVAAISRNDETDYGAKPVLLMPTCKKGSFRDSALIIEMLRQAWKMSPYGELLHGPIWSIASDGDPKRRPALYLHCMYRELTPADPLFEHLGNLPGLNLWTGSGGETQDLDYKHDMKRLCKLFCTRDGLLIDSVVLNKGVLAAWLERLTDVDWSENTIFSLLNTDSSTLERIHTLLSPKDAQDVPRAIKLLNLTADLRNLDSSGFDPSERKTHCALSLLGEMLEALVEPFVNPGFSISQQITSLIKFAHILCALFLKHESAFMPHHLYNDLQCMVRTAIFRVAHTKVLDPQRKVLLCLLGDDVLEVLFGRIRMIGGHSPNVDVDEFRNRCASALRLDGIFQTYMSWERRPDRLKLKRSRDADHLSPRHWRGELRAATCDLLACWESGVAQAEAVLKKAGLNIDFEHHFRDWHQRGVDLMRPAGGKYPGISSEVDRSLGDSETGEGNEEIEEDYSFRSFDGKTALAAETGGTKGSHSIWMELEGGRPAHKKTILRLFTDSSLDLDYHNSHDRLLRVRYFSIGGDGWDRSKSQDLFRHSGGELFKLGKLYASVICTEKKVSVAVLQCTGLKSASQYRDHAPIAEISLPDSRYDVSGQVLSLHPILQSTLDGESLCWVWDSQFVALDPVKATRAQQAATTRLRHLTFTSNGRLVLPLNSSHFASVSVSTLPLIFQGNSESGDTWVIPETKLRDITETLSERLHADDTTRSKIPVFGAVRQGEFPYKAVTYSVTEASTTIEHTIPSIPPPTAANGPQACRICCQQVSGPFRQNHMGEHILRKLRGVVEHFEDIDMGCVSMQYPCGFCGQSSVGGVCDVRIQSGKALSKCLHAYEFKISAASKISSKKACTNVPVQCRLCTEVHWKYNMHQHLQARHPCWEENVSEGRELQEFRDKITITHEEECELGIPEHRRGSWHIVGQNMSPDVRHANPLYLPSVRDEHGDSPRRRREILNPTWSHPVPIQPIQLPIPFNLHSPSALHNLNVFF
ncbi:hypothetical protein FPV67DRAFT_1789064 [Lyophyllum atratum]|nr:hypothetical protein FPV67DRAFT_1789064 [Lyophyllum atratum]